MWKKRLQEDITAAFQYVKGAFKRAGEGFAASSGGDSPKKLKLEEGRFKLAIGKKFFAMSVVRRWTRLPGEVVDAPC